MTIALTTPFTLRALADAIPPDGLTCGVIYEPDTGCYCIAGLVLHLNGVPLTKRYIVIEHLIDDLPDLEDRVYLRDIVSQQGFGTAAVLAEVLPITGQEASDLMEENDTTERRPGETNAQRGERIANYLYDLAKQFEAEGRES